MRSPKKQGWKCERRWVRKPRNADGDSDVNKRWAQDMGTRDGNKRWAQEMGTRDGNKGTEIGNRAKMGTAKSKRSYNKTLEMEWMDS